ncbi:MAG: ATP-dependent Clp protease ATP-binding subunit [Candidatus Tectomicrobia bacterium]|nr:ATP-dependent Clp protease ATP-binding subunit [Candidatus Tectomicrobia bacterium]
MFKRFTERARKVIILAREGAEQHRHGHLGTEHILAGILKDGGGIAIAVLQKLGVDIEVLKNEIEKSMARNATATVEGDIPFTPRAKKVLEYAVEEARSMGHNYIGTEHLLLGLIKEKDGNASKLLLSLGARLVDAREQTLNLLQEPAAPARDKSKTPTLDEFGRDLTELAAEDKLDPVIGRLNEIERVIQILSRRTKNNPVLIGEPGVGKTAIVEGLAQRIVNKEVPQLLYNKRVVALDLGALVAGTKYRGQFEARFKAVMKEIRQSQDVIIFIDELHTLVGAGAAEGSIDASNMLKPALSRGEIQCIGATTLDEYRRYIEKNGALERRFQTIMVDPPSVDDTIKILEGLRDKYEQHHQATIPEVSIVAAVKLSDRYVSGRHLPDKAIDVVDEAGSKVRLQRVTLPPKIRELQKRIEAIVKEKKVYIEKQEFEKAVELRDKEAELRLQFEAEKQKWEEQQGETQAEVTEEDIAQVVSRMTGIPLSKIEEAETAKLLNMRDMLHHRLVGQDEAIEVVTKAVQRSRAGLKSPKRPVGVFIFLGPTGVGKTELGRALAEFLFGSETALIRLDMSEYMERFNVSRLTGAPPGYVGYEEGGQLTERVRRKPYSVVLFDEIEKAHPDIFNILLQIMDDGHLTDSYGRTVDFRNVVLIMTSNISGRAIQKDSALGFHTPDEREAMERMKEKVKAELRRTFNPEFLNRVDETVVFHPLNLEQITKIVDILVNDLNKQLIEKGLTLELEAEAKEHIAKAGFDPAFGARPLKRTIQRLLEDPLSEQVLQGSFKEGGLIVASVEDGKLVFRLKEEQQPAEISVTPE